MKSNNIINNASNHNNNNSYDNINDLDEKVEYYLNNESERIKIENAGYERSRKDHTYDERSKLLIKIINECK